MEDYTDRVLDVVDRIPPGRVMTYGLIAEYLEAGGPRQVAAVMSRVGGAVPWWRVVRADGTLPPALADRADPAYCAEGTPRRPNGAVDVPAALWLPG